MASSDEDEVPAWRRDTAPRHTQDPAYFKLRMGKRSDPKDELLQLVQAGDARELQELLRGWGPEDACDNVQRTTDGEQKRTALHYAATTANRAVLQLLLRVPVLQMRSAMDKHQEQLEHRGRDMEKYGSADDASIFNEWVQTERARLRRDMQLALDRKHNVLLTLRDAHGRTPLCYAAANGHELSTLLKCGRGDLRRPSKLDRSEKVLYEGEGAAELLRARQERVEVLDVCDNNGYTALHYAAVAGNVRAIKQLLALGASTDTLSANGESALDIASTGLARNVLMTVGTAVLRSTKQANSALVGARRTASAGRKGERTQGRRRPANGSDVNESMVQQVSNDVGSETGAGGVSEELQLLVQSGGDVNLREGIGLVAPLHCAAKHGSRSVTLFLLSHNADADVRDANGWAPLHFCAAAGDAAHAKVVSALVDAGAPISSRTAHGLTPLHVAAMAPTVADSQCDVLRELIRHGADIDAEDDKRNTPLHCAARKGRVHAVYCLLQCGACLSATNDQGRNALHVAAMEGGSALAVVRLLSKNDAERHVLRNAKAANGKVPASLCSSAARDELVTLFDAAEAGDLAAVKRKLAQGRRVMEPTPWSHAKLEEKAPRSGRTALHLCVLGCGSRVRKATAAAAAAEEKRCARVIAFLLDSDAVVDRQDRSGATPLHYAAAYGLTVLLRMLVKADDSSEHLDAGDRLGNTPMHYAHAFCCADAIDALHELGANEDLRNATGQAPCDIAGDVTLKRTCFKRW